MFHEIHGVYFYTTNPNLKDYLSQYIDVVKRSGDSDSTVTPAYVISDFQAAGSISYYDLEIAAGSFFELQQTEEVNYIQIEGTAMDPDRYFACKVVEQSMNQMIPNGSICLFEKYQGGSRNGLICLVESNDFMDSEFGAHYTIKKYSSKKTVSEEGWEHQEITLLPMSNDDSFQAIALRDDELLDLKVVGVFKRVLK